MTARSRITATVLAAAIGVGCQVLGAAAQETADNTPGWRLSLDDAIQSALRHGVDIELGRAGQAARRGGLVLAQRAFDLNVRLSVSDDRNVATAAADATSPFVRNTRLGMTLERALRSGVVLSSDVSLAATLPIGAPQASRAIGGVGVTVPLLRGRHGGIDAASEQAARLAYDASLAEANQAASRAVLKVVNAYWEYVTASRRFDTARSAEARAERLVEETGLLIKADERPASDVNLMLANVATKRAARLAAEQRLVDARLGLAVAMGRQPDSIGRIAPPGTDFPDISPSPGWPEPAVRALIARALAHRADAQAAAKMKDSARWLQTATLRELQPRGDLVTRVSYVGAATGGGFGNVMSPLFGSSGGLKTSIQFQYQPVFNSAALRGLAIQQDAAHAQSVALEADLSRRIAAGVVGATEALTRGRAGVEAAREALRQSQLAVETEQKKFQLGMATIFDAILAEDTLANALNAEITALHDYVVAIARLRYETGTMVDFTNAAPSVDVRRLLSEQDR